MPTIHRGEESVNMRTEIPDLIPNLVANQKERAKNKIERKQLEKKISDANKKLLEGVEDLLKPIANDLKMNFEIVFTDSSSIVMKKLGNHEEAMCISYNLIGPNIIFGSKDSVKKWVDKIQEKLTSMKATLGKTELVQEDTLTYVKARLETKTRYF